MSVLPQNRLYTFEEYLELDEKADFKSEFFNGEIFAMAGGTSAHNKIATDLLRTIGNLLRGKRCQTLNSNMKVRIAASGLTTYPDVIVVCDEEKYADAKQTLLLNPTVLIEILSDSTERYDRTVKLKHYKLIPSLQEYVLVAQDEALVQRYRRMPDQIWSQTEVEGLSAVLELESLELRIPLSEFYERVTFPASKPRLSEDH